MKAGDIVLIRFPRTNLQRGKLRPALIVALTPGRHPDILLAMISSRRHQAIPDFDEIVAADSEDFQRSGLKVSSVIRLSRLVTVDASMPQAKLGSISMTRLNRIRGNLASWLLENSHSGEKS